MKNSFQSVYNTTQFLKKQFNINLSNELSDELLQELKQIFEKRHPITHNLGIVDRKYLEHARAAQDEGREVRITKTEIVSGIGLSMQVIKVVSEQLK